MAIKYIITTATGYTEALDALLDSMYVEGINHNDIAISCQNNSNTIDYYKSFLRVNIEQNIYEYSFFISCMKLLDANIFKKTDLFFLIHDTTLLSYNHLNTIKSVVSTNHQYDIIFANCTGRHNIGIYNYKSILLGYKLWKNIDYISKHAAIAIEHNYDFQNLCIKNYNLNIYYPGIAWEDSCVKNIYSNNVPRICSYLRFFCLRKFFLLINPNDIHPNIP